MSKRVLGRGLSALIPEKSNQMQSQIFESKVRQAVANIPIDKIKANKYQPRGDFSQEALKELAVSIKEKGFIQPILVREQEGGYELIAGERRFRAAQLLNLKEVPVIIKEVSDLGSLELSIIENVQREDLNPIDQAKAYQRLLGEFKMTQEKVSDTIGKDRTTVANILRLLKLPQKIQQYVSRGTISMGHAKAILGLDNELKQMRLCTKVIKNELSVRDTERYAKNVSVSLKKTSAEKDPNLVSIEEKLSDAFGTKVKIIKGKKGGRLEVEFYSDTDLERILTLLQYRKG